MNGLTPLRLRDIERRARETRGTISSSRSSFREALTDVSFRTLEDGTKVFYPHGALGRRGYVVASRNEETALRRRVQCESAALAAVSPIVASVYGVFLRDLTALRLLLVLAGVGSVVWLLTKILLWPLTRRLVRSDVPNAPFAAWRRMGRTLHPAWLIVGGLFLSILSVTGFVLYAVERQPSGLVIGPILLVCTVPYVIALRSWWGLRTGRGTGTVA